MSKEFIEKKVGSSSIQLARKQQRQLAYFTQSTVQQEITLDYLKVWGERQFRGNDDFLNWVKTVFKTDNFLSFFKYLRFPISSSKLINQRVIPELKRVFFSEDSFFNYTINGENVEAPESLQIKEFNKLVFDALMFRHNDIMVHDLIDINMPVRHMVSIDNVKALESSNSTIKRIAFSASLPTENGIIQGFLFMDDERFQFFEKETLSILLDVPHDLGVCPADYIADEPFADDDIVRKSRFSYMREELEEYVFLKTLQRMSDPNGAIPVTTVLKTKENEKGDDIKGSSPGHPMSSKEIGSQRARIGSEITESKSVHQAGTVINVKAPRKQDGSVDVDAVKNFINYFHMPVEQLDYINTRVKEIEQSIIISLAGVSKEGKEEAMNELQNKIGLVSKEDRLRDVSFELSRIRQRSDNKMLGFQFGPDRVTNEANYGTDFFQESEEQLLALFEKAPNPIERQRILIKLSQTQNKFNKDKSEKNVLLNKLLPYPSDLDFDKAIDRNIVTDTTFQYQTQFTHWIGIFESQFGDILEFSRMIEGTESEKLVLINNLITQIINQSTIQTIPTE